MFFWSIRAEVIDLTVADVSLGQPETHSFCLTRYPKETYWILVYSSPDMDNILVAGYNVPNISGSSPQVVFRFMYKLNNLGL